jgi:hypothetical protein
MEPAGAASASVSGDPFRSKPAARVEYGKSLSGLAFITGHI